MKLAEEAESNGAMGIVLNPNATNEMIKKLKAAISIPVILTVLSSKVDFAGKIEAGVDIFNVSGANKTAEIVKSIRKVNPSVSIIATGGNTEETIKEVIDAGANAVSFTPPTTGELFREMMDKYRTD